MSFQDGKLYKVKKLDTNHPYWKDVKNSLNRNKKSGTPYIIEELYSISWRYKPFPWSWTREFKPNRRFFFHGTSKDNIQNILDNGFQTGYTKHGKMLGKGVYITYHSNKSRNYAPEDYILSTMIYAPKTLVVNPKEVLNLSLVDSLSKTVDAIEVRTDAVVGAWTMQNHEICVFNPKRVVPRFIIKIKN